MLIHLGMIWANGKKEIEKKYFEYDRRLKVWEIHSIEEKMNIGKDEFI